MQYAVMLYFDEDTSSMAQEYFYKLKDITNNDYMISNNLPLHITLAMWESDYDYVKEIKAFAESNLAFDVVFGSIGYFNDEERHVFLAPVKSRKLMSIHNKLYEIIKLEDEANYIQMYKDTSMWVPHSTIGYQVEGKYFAKALDISTEIKLPHKAKATKIALAACCPFREIAVYELKSE